MLLGLEVMIKTAVTVCLELLSVQYLQRRVVLLLSVFNTLFISEKHTIIYVVNDIIYV